MAQDRKKMKQRSAYRLHFKNRDMDFYLMCILANELHGGASYGEVLRTAGKIRENDPVSWSKEWLNLGQRCEEQAKKALRDGHRTSARNAYLRAYTYFRWGEIGIPVKDPLRRENYIRFVSCFRAGTQLLDTPIEPIEVPWDFRGSASPLPGYFMRPDDSGAKRPTLIVFNGGEMFPEDQYFWAGAGALERGYNVLSLAYDGQQAPPILYPEWEAVNLEEVMKDPEGIHKYIVDYALSRSETDPERLCGIGFSGGGYHLAYQASLDQRIKSIVLAPPLYDPNAMTEEEFPNFLQKIPDRLLNRMTSVGLALNPFTKVAFEHLLSISRVKTMTEFIEMLRHVPPVDPKKVTCPALCLIGEGDSEQERKQSLEFYEKTAAEVKGMHFFTQDEGASAHCQVDNFARLEQIAFDWLDEVLLSAR
jgi:hypothetical protein